VKTGIQFLIVPCCRRDGVWIPVYTGMTGSGQKRNEKGTRHGYKRSNFKFSIFREDEIWVDYRNPSS
jgi:hypothetical protein